MLASRGTSLTDAPLPCGANEDKTLTGSWYSGPNRLEKRRVSGINDSSILCFVLEVRVGMEPLSTSPIFLSNEEKVAHESLPWPSQHHEPEVAFGR